MKKYVALFTVLCAAIAATPLALAQTVAATVPVGASPGGIAANGTTNRVYVANGGAGNVSVLDGAANTVIATINVGSGPRGVAVNQTTNRVYITNQNAGSVSAIDGATNSVAATIAVGSQPTGVDVNAVLNRVYVANSAGNSLSVIDGTTNGVIATVTVNGAVAVAVNATTNRVYTANGASNSVTVLDGGTNGILVPAIALPANALSVAVNATTNRVYVGTSANSVTVIDGSSNAVLGTVAVGAGPYGLAVNAARNRLYAANQVGNSLSIVDTAANLTAATVNVGNAPNAVTVNSATGRVLVANTNGNSVSVVEDSASTATPVLTATTTPGPGTPTTTPGPGTPTVTPAPGTPTVTPAAGTPTVTGTPAPHDARWFAQTGFRVDNDVVWDYFNRRGGVATFGYPVSRTFLFRGVTSQFFQRRVVEIGPNGQARQANLLDPELMPYTRLNGANLPPPDPAVTGAAPAPGDAAGTLQFVQRTAPDQFATRAVNFYQSFANTVPFQIAYPNGGDPNLLPGIDLEMWGVPTSSPAFDPTNQNFVYQRWQRGIMHYDAGCTCTQAILLADYLKAIITGVNLPADLDAQAQASPYYRQYNNAQPNGLNRPAQLPTTNLQLAFEAQ